MRGGVAIDNIKPDGNLTRTLRETFLFGGKYSSTVQRSALEKASRDTERGRGRPFVYTAERLPPVEAPGIERSSTVIRCSPAVPIKATRQRVASSAVRASRQAQAGDAIARPWG